MRCSSSCVIEGRSDCMADSQANSNGSMGSRLVWSAFGDDSGAGSERTEGMDVRTSSGRRALVVTGVTVEAGLLYKQSLNFFEHHSSLKTPVRRSFPFDNNASPDANPFL